MFDALTEKIQGAFSKLRGRGKISAKDIEQTIEEVRLSLLEADVHYSVCQQFTELVSAKALGQEVLQSLSAAQQLIKIVNEVLINILGDREEELSLKQKPAVVMLVGLQGSGKTTSAGKLARFLKEQDGRSPYLVPADVRRPAAIEQLTKIAQELQFPVYQSKVDGNPLKICQKAKKEAASKGFDTVILDTAGRLAIDQPLMKELGKIKSKVEPDEILLVVDSMSGSDVVEVASRFEQELGLSGVILTKLDGDARGGAALSIRQTVGKPIKFVGLGEKFDALEKFHPERMASRILGMGDMLSLIEKAEQNFAEQEAAQLERKIRRNQFTIEDFLSQLKQLKKMGSLAGLLELLPGAGNVKKLLKGVDPEKNLGKVEAIINSMTVVERQNHQLINGSRRKRIALGSGTKVNDVNQFLKQFMQMKQMMKKVNKKGFAGMPGMPGF